MAHFRRRRDDAEGEDRTEDEERGNPYAPGTKKHKKHNKKHKKNKHHHHYGGDGHDHGHGHYGKKSIYTGFFLNI